MSAPMCRSALDAETREPEGIPRTSNVRGPGGDLRAPIARSHPSGTRSPPGGPSKSLANVGSLADDRRFRVASV